MTKCTLILDDSRGFYYMIIHQVRKYVSNSDHL